VSTNKQLATARACAEAMYANDRASQKLGIEVSVPAPGRAEATMTVTADMLNGHDICHGGLVFALADTAFAFACNAYDEVTVAGGGSIDFIRPAKAGDRLVATAGERQRGSRVGVYDVTVRNQAGREVALFRGRAVSTGRPLLPGGQKK